MNLLRPRFYFALVLVPLLTACGPTRVLVLPVDEQGAPLPRAAVSVDGTKQGEGSTTLEVRDKLLHKVVVEHAPEYFPTTVFINRNSPEEKQVALQLDQAYKETVSSEDANVQPNAFVNVNIDPRYQRASEWWRIIVAAVTGADYQPQLMDERSGYLMTQWKEKFYSLGGNKDTYVVRRRFRGNIINISPLRYRMKIEVQRKDPGNSDFLPWDRLYPEDVDLIHEITNRTRTLGTGSFGNNTEFNAPVDSFAADPFISDSAPTTSGEEYPSYPIDE